MNDGNTGGTPGAAADAPSPEEEFAAAFDEHVNPGNDGASADGDGTTGQDQGAVETPAPAFAGATSPTAAPAPAQATPTNDPWSNADPALREAHQTALRDMQLRLDGARGRASGQERELAQLRQRLAQMEAAGNGSQTQAQDSGDNGSGGQAATSDKAQALATLREEYPEVAAPILDELAELRSLVSRLEAPVSQFQQTQFEAAVSAQEQILDAQHPGWLEMIVSDRERFDGWLQAQPKMFQDAYARNADGIVDGVEAAQVIGKFKADLGITAPSNPAPPSPPPANDRRQRQIAAGRDAGRNGPAAATGIPDDFDAAFEAFASRPAR